MKKPNKRKDFCLLSTFFVTTIHEQRQSWKSTARNLTRKRVPGPRIRDESTGAWEVNWLREDVPVLIVPINCDNTHWTLAVINVQKKSLSFYCSMGEDKWPQFDSLEGFVNDEYKRLHGIACPLTILGQVGQDITLGRNIKRTVQTVAFSLRCLPIIFLLGQIYQ